MKKDDFGDGEWKTSLSRGPFCSKKSREERKDEKTKEKQEKEKKKESGSKRRLQLTRMTLYLFAVLVAIAATASTTSFAAEVKSSQPPRCPYGANAYPVHTDEPVLLRTAPNGKMYLAGAGNDTFFVQHVYGSYYEMGYAQGALNKEAIPPGLKQFYAWLTQQAEQKVPWLPEWLAQLIVDVGAGIALEYTFNVTRPFTPKKYIDEMEGVAAGAAVDRLDIYRINMIAELIKAQCSIVGANNKATQYSAGIAGGLVHLRTLDGMGGDTMPIKDLAVVTVYHPDKSAGDGNEPAVANFGWVSFVGSVTAFGEHVGVGEKFWDGTKFNRERGQPWTFVMRDMASSHNFTQARERLHSARRTCSVHLSLGSRADNKFRVFETSGDIFLELDDRTFDYPQHPPLRDVIYIDKFGQPTTSYCFADVLTEMYGNITAEALATVLAPSLGTGDLHAVTMDYPNQIVYFANARKTNVTSGPLKACHRQFTRLNMAKLFREKL